MWVITNVKTLDLLIYKIITIICNKLQGCLGSFFVHKSLKKSELSEYLLTGWKLHAIVAIAVISVLMSREYEFMQMNPKILI